MMTNTELLRGRIKDKGLKLGFIAESCNITRAGLAKKLNNETDFRAGEINVLKNVLDLTNDEVVEIFFS